MIMHEYDFVKNSNFQIYFASFLFIFISQLDCHTSAHQGKPIAQDAYVGIMKQQAFCHSARNRINSVELILIEQPMLLVKK